MLNLPNKAETELKVIHLNKQQNQRREQLLQAINDKKSLKKLKKSLAAKTKKKLKNKEQDSNNKKVFVIDFDGDVKAQEVEQFREEISNIICVANKGDEVVIRLESGGGMVHAYGLAASQIIRLKEAGLTVTACVDKISASGGYMMACVADKILSAPFAVIGSIGVVAQLPNFHKLLKTYNVDYEMFTAGDYKRTVTMFGENDDKGREKFQEDLEQTHTLFKDFVHTYRSQLDLEQVANGDHWYGEDALRLNLVDELKTSDSYILELMKDYQVYALYSSKKQTLAEKLGVAQASEQLVNTAINRLPEIFTKIERNYRENIL